MRWPPWLRLIAVLIMLSIYLPAKWALKHLEVGMDFYD